MILEGRPNPEHASAYATYYFNLSDRQTNLMDSLVQNGLTTAAFIRSIPEDKADFQYADGKWSTKSVIAHLIDTERLFPDLMRTIMPIIHLWITVRWKIWRLNLRLYGLQAFTYFVT